MSVPKRSYHKRGETIQGFLTKDHPLYSTYNNMLRRCYNRDAVGYKNYGGRGIHVCHRWMVFKNFAEDMGLRPDGLTLERINNNKGYTPDNCKWDTRTQQCLNRRTFVNNTSGYTGVKLKNGRWTVSYNEKRVQYNIGGSFDTPHKAFLARTKLIFLLQHDPDAALLMLERPPRFDSTTGVRGVTRHVDGGYMVRKTIKGCRTYLGYFKTIDDAVARLNSCKHSK